MRVIGACTAQPIKGSSRDREISEHKRMGRLLRTGGGVERGVEIRAQGFVRPGAFPCLVLIRRAGFVRSAPLGGFLGLLGALAGQGVGIPSGLHAVGPGAAAVPPDPGQQPEQEQGKQRGAVH